MASVRAPPRQLAPTVGPAAALAGVFIRTGSFIASGERVLCGLVHRFDSLNVVSDNAGCFGSRPLPRNGCLIEVGRPCFWFARRLYVNTTAALVGLPGILNSDETFFSNSGTRHHHYSPSSSLLL